MGLLIFLNEINLHLGFIFYPRFLWFYGYFGLYGNMEIRFSWLTVVSIKFDSRWQLIFW